MADPGNVQAIVASAQKAITTPFRILHKGVSRVVLDEANSPLLSAARMTHGDNSWAAGPTLTRWLANSKPPRIEILLFKGIDIS